MGTINKVGIYRDISSSEYHSGPGLGSSQLGELARSPLHYITSVNSPHKETPATKLGTATHCAILEPERFDIEYIEAPCIDRRTKDGKAIWSEIEQSGKIILSSDEYSRVTEMANAIRSHDLASKLLQGGVCEQSVYWNQKVSSLDMPEILCKARPDYIKPLKKGYIIVDIKTTQDAHISEFQRKAYYKWRYYLQAAHYVRGFEAVTGEKVTAFMYVVIESEAPYAISIFKAGDDYLKVGEDKIQELYELYASCMVSNNWPSYSDEIQELRLPKWA
ncbi:MAG: PD-(D/E)XK nuclease-like domain-containing protein [Synergistaceae bacterium]|nr:PD-(D/E)XK nuclease-like domain-containing protein [Synergistaceae bacterium]